MKKESGKTKFTDAEVRNMKTDKRLQDNLEGDGFGVRVYASGTKVFYYAYSCDNKRRFLNLGEYGTVTLSEARKRHTVAKYKLDKGIDPLFEKDAEKKERALTPFVADFVGEYIKYAKEHNRGWKEIERALMANIVPAWGKQKITDIKRRDLVLVLDEIKKRGAPVMANRVLAYTRKMFSYAINERGIVMLNPFLMMKRPNKEESRERVLDDAEIKIFWRNLDTCIMGEPLKRALKLILVTGQRPGEIIAMHRSEIDSDWLEIPALRSKNKLPHRVFLTVTAKKLIGNAPGFIFESPIFPADPNSTPSDPGKPYGERTLTCGIKDNLPHKPESKVVDRLKIPHFTPHDLRRTTATQWAGLGITEDMIDRLQNHITKRKQSVGHVYNRYSYAKEKQQAMETWERKLNSIITGSKYIDSEAVDAAKLQTLETNEQDLETREMALISRAPKNKNKGTKIIDINQRLRNRK
ncbi:MAG: integrase arm-type DNA-binding domain-containing protein [Desulfuromonadaceae bacterium]|nr:integrase arm-type DNA-binding domain-containing protein [Desulfuromonadaceae bacterium]